MADKLGCEKAFTSEQLRAIGCLAIESNTLEGSVDKFISAYVKDPVKTMLVEGKMIGTKLNILKELLLARVKSNIKKRKINETIAAIKSDIVLRNTVIHGAWAFSDMDKLLDLMKPETPPRNDAFALGKSNPVKASDVRDLAVRFVHHRRTLYRAFLSTRKPLRPRLRKRSAHQS